MGATLKLTEVHETNDEKTRRNGKRLTGHAARRGGAQFLTARGIPLYVVQLLGRWGSDAIRIYVDETPLDWLAGLAPQALNHLSVEHARVAPRPPDDFGHVADALRAELADELNRIRQDDQAPDGPFATNLRNGVVHKVVAQAEPRTVCGLLLDVPYARYRRARRAPPSDLRCSRCWPVPAAPPGAGAEVLSRPE